MNRRIVPIVSVFLFLLIFSFVTFAADCVQTSVVCNATNNDTWPCLSANETFNYTYWFVDCSESLGVSMPISAWDILDSPSDSQYVPGENYTFRLINPPINASNNETDIYNISFESNYTLNASEAGILTEYYYPDVTNVSNNYTIVLTDLPAQSFIYNWHWYVNNGTHDIEYYFNNNFSLTISKANNSVYLFLDGQENNRTYGINETANFSASLPVTNETIYLESDYPGWVNQNSSNSSVSYSINLTDPGTYNVTAYWNGNENYTNSSETYFFTVANAAWSDNQTSPASGLNYTKNQTYDFQIKVIGDISDVIFEADFNNTLINYTLSGINVTNWNITKNISNDTNGNYWINFTDLGADSYNYRWIIVDNDSVELTTGSLIYLINAIVPTVTLTLDDYEVTPSSTVTATCSVTPVANLTLYITGLGLSSCSGNDSVSCSFTASSNTGMFTYYCYNAGNENYSITTVSKDLEVYTFSSNDDSSGDTTTTTTTGQFLITSSDSSITMDAGTSKVVTFTLSNTLDNDLNVTSITVSGITDDWYALDKTAISRLNDGTTEKVRMTLNIPANTTAGNYTIKVKATAKNLFSGSTLTKETNVALTVNSNISSEDLEALALTTDGSEELADGGNQTTDWILPTALFSMSSEYFPFMVLILAIAMSIIIFVKRDTITTNFMKMGGVKKTKEKSKNKFKLQEIKNLFAGKKQKTSDAKMLEMEEEKADDLEREIKKDMKELQNILEAEKKIKKKRK